MRSMPDQVPDEVLRASVEAYLAAHPHDDDVEPDVVPEEPDRDDAPTDEAFAALIDAYLADEPDDDSCDTRPPRPREPLRPGRVLPPEVCLEGVTDPDALTWASLTPGTHLLAAVEDLWDHLATDLAAACAPIPEPEPGAEPRAVDGAVPDAVSDAVLVEAVAACDRQLAALTARRDTFAGVFATRRRTEAQQDVDDARRATAADGKGRPWATRARSTAPSEIAARLGIGDRAAETLVDRGLAALGPQRDVATAMSAGALQASAGTWLLEELEGVRATAFATALERATTQAEAALAALRAAEAEAITAGDTPPLTAEELREQARADQQRIDEQAQAAAAEHAEQVTARVRRELLERATGLGTWPGDGDGDGDGDGGEERDPADAPTDPAGETPDDADDAAPADPAASPAPTSRPTGGAGLGATRRTWKHALTRAVQRADAAAAAARADKARAAASVQHWNEGDDQAALQLRGPAEVIARIFAAMNARAHRRQADARAAERAAAKEQGRPFDRSAVGSLDQHRLAALEEWATAALEISETSGVSGTWYPIARTAASKPSVSIVIPWTVLAGVSTVGAQLAGYGPIGAAAALRIAGDGVWRRVFADPGTGAAVGVEEGAWRPSTALARLVSMRWAGSTLPGSTRPVGWEAGAGRGGGQLDHVQPYARDEAGRSVGGPTEATNLQLLAAVEHLLKQAGEHARAGHGWSVAVDRTGSAGDGGTAGPAPGDGVVWTSPTGHTYRVSPQQLLEPDAAPVEGLPGWTHELLADVLPAWVGWPPDGPGEGTRGAAEWSQDWASAAFSDVAADTPTGDVDHDAGPEPFLFDDLPVEE